MNAKVIPIGGIEACLHKTCYYIGEQEIPRSSETLSIGTCIGCDSTISIADFREVNNMWAMYNGKRYPIYRRKPDNMRRGYE